jgi:hypothetical protein
VPQGAGVAEGLQQVPQPAVHEAPRPHVLRLLLDPADVGRRPGSAAAPRDLAVRERVELLEADDGDGRVALVALVHQVVGDLAGAQQHGPHLGGITTTPSATASDGRVVEHLLRTPSGERLDRRRSSEGARSSDFGVNTTSGLRSPRCS